MKRILLFILIFVIAVSMSACGKKPVSSLFYSADEIGENAERTPLFLYFSNAEKTMLCLEIRYVSDEFENLDTAKKAEEVVKELLKGPTQSTGLKSFIPLNTVLRSPVTVRDGCAEIDFSSDLKNTQGRTMAEERAIIYSVVNSVTEIEGVNTVLFKIDGQLNENYLGNFKFNVPFPRNEALIYNPIEN